MSKTNQNNNKVINELKNRSNVKTIMHKRFQMDDWIHPRDQGVKKCGFHFLFVTCMMLDEGLFCLIL